MQVRSCTPTRPHSPAGQSASGPRCHSHRPPARRQHREPSTWQWGRRSPGRREGAVSVDEVATADHVDDQQCHAPVARGAGFGTDRMISCLYAPRRAAGHRRAPLHRGGCAGSPESRYLARWQDWLHSKFASNPKSRCPANSCRGGPVGAITRCMQRPDIRHRADVRRLLVGIKRPKQRPLPLAEQRRSSTMRTCMTRTMAPIVGAAMRQMNKRRLGATGPIAYGARGSGRRQTGSVECARCPDAGVALVCGGKTRRRSRVAPSPSTWRKRAAWQAARMRGSTAQAARSLAAARMSRGHCAIPSSVRLWDIRYAHCRSRSISRRGCVPTD